METMNKREFYFYPQPKIIQTFDKIVLDQKEIMFAFGFNQSDRTTFSDILHLHPLGVISEEGDAMFEIDDLGYFMYLYSMSFADKGAVDLKAKLKEDGTEYPLLQGENVFQYAKLKYPELHGLKKSEFLRLIMFKEHLFFTPFVYTPHRWEQIREYLHKITGITLGQTASHIANDWPIYWRYKKHYEVRYNDGRIDQDESEGQDSRDAYVNISNYIYHRDDGYEDKKHEKFQCFFNTESKVRYKCLVVVYASTVMDGGGRKEVFDGCGLIEFENAWNIVYESDWITGNFESPWFENVTEPVSKEDNLSYGWQSRNIRLIIIPELYDAYHPVTLEPIILVEPEENKT